MNVLHIVGARPNFMKVAPVMAAIERQRGVMQALVHTGQHYDANMSEVFFAQLGIPVPDLNLEVGSGSHAEQTANVMARLEPVILERQPDIVLVYGDVNSTLAAALVCAKLSVSVAHVEAGLRSFDRSMPEEINRLLTDQVADLLFTPSAEAGDNLLREGVAAEKIHYVGNVMIDTLVRLLPRANSAGLVNLPERYVLVTLHRPSNVDDLPMLRRIMDALDEISRQLRVLFPIHPRTRQRLHECGIEVTLNGQLQLMDPIGYLEFLALQRQACVVITDSGGIQEECTYLGVPCLTLRETTERPVTVTIGTNIVVGRDMRRLHREVDRIVAGKAKQGAIPPLWDGKASERIADLLVAWHHNRTSGQTVPFGADPTASHSGS
ncbi:MAG: UDP-N-acetylglucosamine 2-epimerase (non-hydrolyzing) [Terriglobia bacterium]